MDDQEERALMGTVAIGSMVSFVSVLFLLTSAIALGKWKKSYWRVILALALSDMVVAGSFVPSLFPPPPSHPCLVIIILFIFL
jgi:hypothetical protein